jgi:phenylacetate-coenzyme A ligase PaaK-like adenylate-forming protein
MLRPIAAGAEVIKEAAQKSIEQWAKASALNCYGTCFRLPTSLLRLPC